MTTNSTTWNLPPPPGFQGLRDDLPLTMYDRHLPHWRQDGATYAVTFRLADSLPREKAAYLKRIRADWERRHPEPRTDADWEALVRETTRWIDGWLDEGLGSCCLRDSTSSGKVAQSLHYFDAPLASVGWTSGPTASKVGPEVQPTYDRPEVQPMSSGDVRYELGCYVIMPNHVHVIVRPLECAAYPLEKILQSWKTFTAREINLLLQQSGMLWQQESYDRILRNEEHLWRAIQYIGENPLKARLKPGEYRLWIRPSWQALGWKFANLT